MSMGGGIDLSQIGAQEKAMEYRNALIKMGCAQQILSQLLPLHVMWARKDAVKRLAERDNQVYNEEYEPDAAELAAETKLDLAPGINLALYASEVLMVRLGLIPPTPAMLAQQRENEANQARESRR